MIDCFFQMVENGNKKRQDKVSTNTEVLDNFGLHYTQYSFQNSRVTTCESIQVQLRSVAKSSSTCLLIF